MDDDDDDDDMHRFVTVAGHASNEHAVLSEHLIASFILQMHDSPSETMVAMAAGAALALQCYEHPVETAEMVTERGDALEVSKAGLAVAKDIHTAYEAAWRVRALASGMTVSEVEDMVAKMHDDNDGSWHSRTEVIRELETILLNSKMAEGE